MDYPWLDLSELSSQPLPTPVTERASAYFLKPDPGLQSAPATDRNHLLGSPSQAFHRDDESRPLEKVYGNSPSSGSLTNPAEPDPPQNQQTVEMPKPLGCYDPPSPWQDPNFLGKIDSLKLSTPPTSFPQQNPFASQAIKEDDEDKPPWK